MMRYERIGPAMWRLLEEAAYEPIVVTRREYRLRLANLLRMRGLCTLHGQGDGSYQIQLTEAGHGAAQKGNCK